jgi:hypothetical protein
MGNLELGDLNSILGIKEAELKLLTGNIEFFCSIKNEIKNVHYFLAFLRDGFLHG